MTDNGNHGSEEGVVQPIVSPQTPIVVMATSGADQFVLLGEIKNETSNIKARLEKIEDKLGEIEDRLKGIEAAFDVLETIPKLGEQIKKIRKDKKLI